MSDTAIWQAVLGELQVSTSKANYETWLRNTKLLSLQEEVAVISVPNIFIRGWLETHYKDNFLSSFQKHGRAINEIRFEIEGSQAAIQPESSYSPPTPSGSPAPVPVVAQVETTEADYSETPIDPPSTIIRKNTFDTFVIGNNNRLAYNVSLVVAKNPGTLHNPLFIYGGVGLGKTHLMHAIANEILRNDPKKRVQYVSCETFTNDYIAGISSRKMDQFKKKYRTVDLLLVDDIQFLANKEGSQEEFFNTFNTLHQSNRQIIIASDRVPNAIPGLEERLSSRFGWGMIVDIQTPNLETRTAILKSKCDERHIDYPQDALAYIAAQVQSNIRELEGALNRCITYCQIMNVPYSLEATRAALSGLIVPAHRKRHTPDTLLRLIAEHFGMGMDELIGKKRTKELVYPRQLAMYLLRENLNLSFPEIGRELGGKDHTTIIHGYQKVIALLPNDVRLQSDVSAIKERLHGM